MADLSYVDQHTEVLYAGMEVTNERQKVQVMSTLSSLLIQHYSMMWKRNEKCLLIPM